MEYPETARNVTGTHEKRRRWRRAVSVLACAVVFCTTYALILPAITLSAEPKCGLEEHTHTEDCYETRLVCGQTESGPETAPETAADPVDGTAPESDPAPAEDSGDAPSPESVPEDAAPTESAHVHTEACYQQVLTCGKPEHTHTDACWSDPAAAEDPKDWEPEDLTGDWNRDTLAVALAQEGYRPSEDYFTVDDAGEHIGYTRYGDWSGDPFGEWNLSFAAFCLRFGGAAEEAFPAETTAESWRTALDARDLYQPLEGAEPGDLIFLDSDGDGEADRVGIFTGWQDVETETSAQPERRFAVMEGDLDGEAAQALYDPEDAALLGRASPDEAADAWYLCGEKAHIHGDDCYDGTGALTCGKTEHIHGEDCRFPESRSFTYEDEALSMTVTVLTPAPLPEDTELAVTEEDASTLAAEDADTEESGQWLLRGLALTQNGQALEIADCRMTAEVALTERVFAPLAAEAAVLAEDAAPEAEVGVVLSAWQADEDAGLQEVESVLLEEETATLTVPVEDGMLALYAGSTANPSYTVQYYANIPRFAGSGNQALDVFDTSGAANGNNGPQLPTNNGTNKVKQIWLNGGNGTYTVATESVLTEMYSPNSFEYIKAPNPSYIDKLEENGNYRLTTVQVRNSDGSWTDYPADDVHFTNRTAAADAAKHIIYITEGTVIRLIYDASDASFTAPSTFYDYNISGGQNGDRKWRTGITGINSEGNYGTSADGNTTWRSYRDVLAFGNANTGTGMANYKFNYTNGDSVYLNRHSQRNYGCAFGLVSGLQIGSDGTWSNGTIKYNSHIVAPNLFNDGDADDKQTYADSSLTFKRVGDTYTLSSATLNDNGTAKTIGSLETFINPTNSNGTHTTIFTNSFWPMDGASQRKDPLFGANGDTTSYQGFASADGVQGSWSAESTTFPLSDDGQNHNSYFGMHYAVTFELTSDYVGPLEYYFFGDDDMWVFLDDQLVCDIGGVHSSVGEYVDLWDYIQKGSSGTHTLSFFYTERGASGSTCYMNFTLPSVSGATPQQKSGDLRVEKEVVGLDNGQDFEFTVSFADQNGNQNPDDFVYDKYNANGSLKESNLIVHDEGRFTLRAGEYVIIKYVPFGTYYTITEADTTDYSTSWRGNDGITHSGKTATGCILKGEINRTSVLRFTNTAKPNTHLNVKKAAPDGTALSGATFTLTPQGSEDEVEFTKNRDGNYTVYHEELYPEIKENEGYYIALASDPEWGIGNVNGSAKLKQGGSRQVFYVRHEADGSYSFHTSDNNWLNLSGNNVTSGTEILIYNENNKTPPDPNELWYLLRNSDGSYRIQPKLAVIHGTSAVLDLNAANVKENEKIQVWEDNGTNAQKWKLVPVNPVAKPDTVTELAVSSQGQLYLNGLIPGTYTLTETQAPDHYQQLTKPISITVDRKGRITLGDGTPADAAKVTTDGNDVLLTVFNKPNAVTLTLTKQVVGLTGVTREFPFKITYQLGTESKEQMIQLAHGKSQTITGIPYGATVTITETAHDGFSVLFKEGDALKANGDSCTFTITSNVTITAENHTGYQLPSTGGMGTGWFTLAGLLLMTGAAALTISRRRAKEGGPE